MWTKDIGTGTKEARRRQGECNRCWHIWSTGKAKVEIGLDSFVLQKQTDRESHWASDSMALWSMLPRSYWGKISKWEGATRYNSEGNTSWKPSLSKYFMLKEQHFKSHWLTVSNKHCPPGTTCVYGSTRGAITADTKNQVAAVMHYKEAEIVCLKSWMLTFRSVAVYELCAGNDPIGITWEHDQLRSHV